MGRIAAIVIGGLLLLVLSSCFPPQILSGRYHNQEGDFRLDLPFELVELRSMDPRNRPAVWYYFRDGKDYMTLSHIYSRPPLEEYSRYLLKDDREHIQYTIYHSNENNIATYLVALTFTNLGVIKGKQVLIRHQRWLEVRKWFQHPRKRYVYYNSYLIQDQEIKQDMAYPSCHLTHLVFSGESFSMQDIEDQLNIVSSYTNLSPGN